MQKNPDSVVVEIKGGLGNALFQYSAGLFLANKIGVSLCIDIKYISQAKTNHGFFLEEILPSIYVIDSTLGLSRTKKKISKFRDRVINATSRRIPQLLKSLSPSIFVYNSKVIGYDPSLETLSKPIRINGYFQTWRYFSSLDFKVEIQKEVATKWFKDMMRAAHKIKPIIIHVRRGDYSSHIDSFGLLNRDYYLRALNQIPRELKNNEIWVFSDEIDVAIKLLGDILPLSTKWINPPPESSPVESLLLMTQGVAHIIANSTFSYWGALLSKKTSIVLAPDKWFKGLDDPEELIHPDWHKIKSSWQ